MHAAPRGRLGALVAHLDSDLHDARRAIAVREAPNLDDSSIEGMGAACESMNLRRDLARR